MCLTERKEKRRRRRTQPRRRGKLPAIRVEGERSGCYDKGTTSMYTPCVLWKFSLSGRREEWVLRQGDDKGTTRAQFLSSFLFVADPDLSAACMDAKRLRCYLTPAPKVLDNVNTSSLLAPAPPLDYENLLQEILLLIPPWPSALPRASLVCKHWRNILSDPEFLKRFRKHHRKPPLLGFFTLKETGTKHNFVPVLDTKPDRIPAERFTLPKSSSPFDRWHFLGSRHGLDVLLNECRREVVVWDPLTGQQHRVPYPPSLRNAKWETVCVAHAAVLCTDAEDGHVHGDCFSSPFQVVFICGGHTQTQTFACLYQSAAGSWGNIASTVTTGTVVLRRSSVLIGNAVYWLFRGGDILVFDIERQTLDVIEMPAATHYTDSWSFQLLRTYDDCGLCLAVMSNLSINLWKWKSNCDGVMGWVLLQTIQLEGIFPQAMPSFHKKAVMVGYDEESNVIVLTTYIGDFMLQIESMRLGPISESRYCWSSKVYYPYRNFYTPGRGVRWKWVDLEL